MAAQIDDPRDVQRLSAELAYQGLPAAAARVFRLLAVHPGPDVSVAAVAALADVPFAEARGVLLFSEQGGSCPGGTRHRPVADA